MSGLWLGNGAIKTGKGKRNPTRGRAREQEEVEKQQRELVGQRVQRRECVCVYLCMYVCV